MCQLLPLSHHRREPPFDGGGSLSGAQTMHKCFMQYVALCDEIFGLFVEFLALALKFLQFFRLQRADDIKSRLVLELLKVHLFVVINNRHTPFSSTADCATLRVFVRQPLTGRVSLPSVDAHRKSSAGIPLTTGPLISSTNKLCLLAPTTRSSGCKFLAHRTNEAAELTRIAPKTVNRLPHHCPFN